MNIPLLSICIATYNRADFIGGTLESIIPQLNDQIEVVIADGASTDNTAAVVNEIVKNHPQIRYINLGVKGGVDQDYCKAVELAKAEMCWLFTDDDLIKPGAITRVLSEISNGYSLIVVNAEVRNIDFSKVIHKSQIKLKSDEIFHPTELDNLFRCIIPYASFIGGVIVNKQLWLQRDKEVYFGTEFIHVGVIFQKPLPEKALVISTPLITIRLGNAQWTQRSFEIWIIKWPKLLCSFQHISEASKKEYSTRPSLKKLANLIHQRSEAAFSHKQLQLWSNSFSESPAWWRLTINIISRIPIPIAKMVIASYVGLKER